MTSQVWFGQRRKWTKNLAGGLLGLALLVCIGGCGGTGASQQPPPPPSPPPPVSVSISPATSSVAQGGTATLTATVTGSNNTAVTWSVQEGAAGGAVTSAGVYTAPQAPGTFHVVATSQADSTKSATATLTVPSVSVAITPTEVTLAALAAQSFTATVTGSINTTVTWSVQEGTAGGAVTGAGVYTAPGITGTYHVVVISQADNTKSAMATVTVPPISVAIGPQTATLLPSGTLTFIATVTGTLNTAVTWAIQEGAAGGTVDGSGHYTAPATLATYHVVATSVADPGKSASAAVTVVQSGFTPTGSMGTARTFHTATLLPNGQVLVTGAGTAELYDPATGRFTATGNMVAVRYNHTATLLPNGKVLIAGGADGSGLTLGGLTSGHHILASTELFDPATGSFTANADMGTARALHTATLLANGKVLLVGGLDNESLSTGLAIASAELYDPAGGTFTAAGRMGQARESHTATLLANGEVLVAGGLVFVFGPIASAELFDPASGAFTATGSMTSERTYHTATLLPNGKVLIAGGLDNFAVSLEGAELFDPASGSGSFTAAGFIGARAFHTATLLPSGEVLMAGGVDSRPCNIDDCPRVTLANAVLFSPASGSSSVTGSMGTARESHTATLLPDGRVLVIGGVFSPVAPTTAELYQ